MFGGKTATPSGDSFWNVDSNVLFEMVVKNKKVFQFNNSLFQILGNSYAPLTNSPLSSALATAQTTLGNPGQPGSVQAGHLAGANAGVPIGAPSPNSGQQFVSYNGDTYLIQTSPNGTHQLVATLNGARSISPNQDNNTAVQAAAAAAATAANLITLEKPFSPNETSGGAAADSSSTPQICKSLDHPKGNVRFC